MNVLVKYDAACRAVAEAASVDEVKDIRDKAEAMRAYGRQAKNKQFEVLGAEMRIRAERRLGELMAERRDGDGLNRGTAGAGAANVTGGSRTNPPDARPTLASAGIGKNLADRARKLAAVPDDEFEAKLGEWRERVEDENAKVSVDLMAAGERELRRKAEEVNTAAIGPAIEPAGEFETIVIDPPWPMQKIERNVRPNQVAFDYPTMGEAELAALRIPAAADAHLFLWTTQKFLPMAFRLLDVWGFRYVCTFVWHKPGGFQPIGLPQYNCEFALYARIGSPKFIDTKAFPTCFDAPRREHSRKPDEFYDMVRRVTAGRRLDMFSREAREGFEQFGNEIAKFSGAA